MLNDLLVALWLLLFWTVPVQAYIDPGTGMSFVSGMGAIILGFLATVFGGLALTFKSWTAALRRWIRSRRTKA